MVPPTWISRSDRLLPARRSGPLGGHGRGAQVTNCRRGTPPAQEANLPHSCVPCLSGAAPLAPRGVPACASGASAHRILPGRHRRRRGMAAGPTAARLRTYPTSRQSSGGGRAALSPRCHCAAPRGLLDASRRFDHRRPGGFAAQCGVPAADERVEVLLGVVQRLGRRDQAGLVLAGSGEGCERVPPLHVGLGGFGDLLLEAGEPSGARRGCLLVGLDSLVARRAGVLDRPPEAFDGVAQGLLVRIVRPGGFRAERAGMREIGVGSRSSVTTPFSRTGPAETGALCDTWQVSDPT